MERKFTHENPQGLYLPLILEDLHNNLTDTGLDEKCNQAFYIIRYNAEDNTTRLYESNSRYHSSRVDQIINDIPPSVVLHWGVAGALGTVIFPEWRIKMKMEEFLPKHVQSGWTWPAWGYHPVPRYFVDDNGIKYIWTYKADNPRPYECLKESGSILAAYDLCAPKLQDSKLDRYSGNQLKISAGIHKFRIQTLASYMIMRQSKNIKSLRVDPLIHT